MTRPLSLHVLHVVDALSLGGAERMLVEIANRTVADGHRASVCVTRSGVAMAPQLDARIELLVLGRQRRLEVRPLVRLAQWIGAHDVDVVHCHGRSSFSLVAMLAATHALWRPIVLHDHLGVELHPDVPTWFRVAKRYIAAYAGVYAGQLAWAHRAGVPPERTHVIPNAIDMAALARQKLIGAPLAEFGGPRLIFIGGLRREKAVDVLLEAVALVRAPVILHIVGGDADPAYACGCRDRAAKPDLAKRVVFEGQRVDALALASTADLAVHSSRSESGPLVLAEYAALGVPFVSTRVGGVATKLASAGAGLFVPADDAVALAQAIDGMLAETSGERQRLGRSWGEIARSLFDLSTAMPSWYRLYDQVLQR